MQALLNAGPFTLTPIKRDVDRYGRKLRIVERDGVSLGAILVRHGPRAALWRRQALALVLAELPHLT